MNYTLRPPGPLVCVVGARPNYMKMAPLVRAFGARPNMPAVVLVHTGQHYDVEMNERLFADLELPPPDLNLEVGSASHAVQTAEIMRRFEPVLDRLGAEWGDRRRGRQFNSCVQPGCEPRSVRRSSTWKRDYAVSIATCRRRSIAS